MFPWLSKGGEQPARPQTAPARPSKVFSPSTEPAEPAVTQRNTYGAFGSAERAEPARRRHDPSKVFSGAKDASSPTPQTSKSDYGHWHDQPAASPAKKPAEVDAPAYGHFAPTPSASPKKKKAAESDAPGYGHFSPQANGSAPRRKQAAEPASGRSSDSYGGFHPKPSAAADPAPAAAEPPAAPAFQPAAAAPVYEWSASASSAAPASSAAAAAADPAAETEANAAPAALKPRKSSKELIREARGKMVQKNQGKLGNVTTTAQGAFPAHTDAERPKPLKKADDLKFTGEIEKSVTSRDTFKGHADAPRTTAIVPPTSLKTEGAFEGSSALRDAHGPPPADAKRPQSARRPDDLKFQGDMEKNATSRETFKGHADAPRTTAIVPPTSLKTEGAFEGSSALRDAHGPPPADAKRPQSARRPDDLKFQGDIEASAHSRETFKDPGPQPQTVIVFRRDSLMGSAPLVEDHGGPEHLGLD